ncbi:MAG: site-specific DNA-methyltransferase [Acidobacteriota bacterium]|nr:site-specific DNA-methyltransferase [Acidobacteriota bacterium]
MAKKTSPLLSLAIQYLAISLIKPNPNNVRLHPQSQLRKLAESLREFGFLVPILIDDDGMILAGHARYQAALLLGLTAVPVVRVSHLTEKQRRAFLLADNKLASLSSFDMEKLAVEFEYLLDGNDSHTISTTGFDIVEVDKVLGNDRAAPAEEVVELPADAAVPVSQPGDLWLIGKHRLLCGSCLDRMNVERLFAGEKASAVVADPPYGIAIENNVSGLGAKKHKDFMMGCAEMSDVELTFSFFRPAFQLMAEFSHPGAIAFIFMDWRHARHVQNAADGVFLEHKNTIVWVKSNPGLGSWYRSQHEFVLAFKMSAGPTTNNFGLGGQGRVRSNVWQYPGANVFRAGRKQDLEDHPTVKNLKMCADAILDVSAPGDIIFDPFLGSGTTISAAAATGRRGFGLEIDPKYVDVIIRRVTEKTGLIARLEDGRTFAEVAAERGVKVEEGR